jgi:hypothetical protein
MRGIRVSMAPLNTNVVPFTIMYYECCHSVGHTVCAVACVVVSTKSGRRPAAIAAVEKACCTYNVLPAHQTDVELTFHDLLSRMQYNAASGFSESCSLLPLQSGSDEALRGYHLGVP